MRLMEFGKLVILSSALLASATVADEVGRPAPVIIQYGLDPDREDKRDEVSNPEVTLDQYGAVGSVLAGWANRSVARENYRNTMITLELAGVDLDEVFQERWRCFGLPDATDECRRLVINGPNGLIGNTADVDPASNSHAIAISIFFSVEWFRGIHQHVGANVRVFLLESDGDSYEIVDQFVHWYKSGAPDNIDQAPFYLKPDKVGASEMKKRAASRAYWFDDGAEPVSALVEDFGRYFPGLLDVLFDAMVTSEGRLEFKDWYKSLPTVSSVFDKKASKCVRDLCSYSIISLDNPDARHWLIKPFNRAPIIRAVPAEWFSRVQ